MAATTAEQITNTRRAVRLAALAGMAAPVLFVALFTAQGWVRAGYDPASMFVSELSLGPWGWVQVANFGVTGLLIIWFVSGVRSTFTVGRASRVGPVLLRIIGISLLASGPFVTDPSVLFSQVSVHGVVHGLFGAVVFSLAPVSCFVYSHRFWQQEGWHVFARWSLLAGIILVLGIVLLKVSQFPTGNLFVWKGAIQRVVLITFMAWLFALSLRLYRWPPSDSARGH